MQRTGISRVDVFSRRYNYDYSKYEPYIVPHKSDPKKLFCIVTMTSLNKVLLCVCGYIDSGSCRACSEFKKV